MLEKWFSTGSSLPPRDIWQCLETFLLSQQGEGHLKGGEAREAAKHPTGHKSVPNCSDASGKESACQLRRRRRHGFDPWVGKLPWRRKWLPTPVFLPGEFHGQRSLVGYSAWGYKESDTTEVT